MRHFLILILVTLFLDVRAQESGFRNADLTWMSFTANANVSSKWGGVVDLHHTRKDQMTLSNFYFMRLGPTYRINKMLFASVGYAHIWFNPANSRTVFGSEHWVYEEIMAKYRWIGLKTFTRVRVENRFKKVIAEGHYTGELDYFNRIRFLHGVSIPLWFLGDRTQLAIYDEVMFGFGPDYPIAPFDQNRLTFLAKQQIGQQWYAGIGYMNLYMNRQTNTMYHTLRLMLSASFDLSGS